jgi:hypothetical protein
LQQQIYKILKMVKKSEKPQVGIANTSLPTLPNSEKTGTAKSQMLTTKQDRAILNN